jgi:hypothetical protein
MPGMSELQPLLAFAVTAFGVALALGLVMLTIAIWEFGASG